MGIFFKKTKTMDSEKKTYNKGGKNSRYEPTHIHDIIASSFINKSFEYVGCLGFYEKVQQVYYHCELTTLFATNFKRDKTTIAWMDFMVSAEEIGMIFRVLRSFATNRDSLTSKSCSKAMKINFKNIYCNFSITFEDLIQQLSTSFAQTDLIV